MIPQGLMAKLLSRAGESLLNLKDLLTVLPRSCGATFSGFAGRPKRRHVDLLIPQGLLAKLPRRTGKCLFNLKDLLTVFPSSCRATLSGSFGRPITSDGNLLIRLWLLAKCRKRVGEGLLNLKDLLTVLQPSLGRSFENEPVLRRLFRAESRQIPPFSGENMQIMAENGGFLAPILVESAMS